MRLTVNRPPKSGPKRAQNVVPEIGVSAGVMGQILGFNRGIGVLGPPKWPFLGSKMAQKWVKNGVNLEPGNVILASKVVPKRGQKGVKNDPF